MRASGGLRIGVVASRLGGIDGVSMEAQAWSRALRELGHEVWSFAGRVEVPLERCRVESLAFFGHPDVEAINAGIFGPSSPDVDVPVGPTGDIDVDARVEAMSAQLQGQLKDFIRAADLQMLLAENVVSLPLHVPLGIALTRLAADTGIPILAHHHDLPWERDRFRFPARRWIIDEAFPPRLPNVYHVCINSHQRSEIERRVGRSARVIPNTIDVREVPKPTPPDLRADLGVAAHELLVIQPTRIVPRKGIEHALELVRRLDRPAKLVVTGASGDEGHAYRRHIDTLARLLSVDVVWASDRVSMQRGQRPDGRPVHSVDDVFRVADLVTYPSALEGFGRAFLAAVRHRRPIVVNRYPIYDLDIRPLGFKVVEMDGFVTEDTVALARTLLEDPNLRTEWAAHNHELVRRHFSTDVLRRELRATLADMFS